MADMVLEDLVIETTETTGAGTYDLGGPVEPYRGIVAAIGDGMEAPFLVTDGVGGMEALMGTVTDAAPDTLSRDIILWSTNAGAAVSWGTGIKHVRLYWPAYLHAARYRDVRTMAGDKTIAIADQGVLYVLDAAAADRAFTLPAGSGLPPGFTAACMKIGSGNKVEVKTTGGDTLNGIAPISNVVWTLRQTYEQIDVAWDGSGWKLIGQVVPHITPTQGFASAFYA